MDSHIAGVHVGVISPKSGVAAGNQHRILINLHGGGFYAFRGLGMGQIESIPVAALGGFKIITVDYRQAPFAQYPAASEDVEAVYRELLKQYKPEAIGIFGCSSGGSLAAQVIAWFQYKGLPRPGAVGVLCAAPPASPQPWGRGGDSKMWFPDGAPGVLSAPPPDPPAAGSRTAAAQINPLFWYMERADSSDPRAYPASSNPVLARFPPRCS